MHYQFLRFKLVAYATESDKKMVAAPIKNMLMTFISEEQKDIILKEESAPNKKSRMSGMQLVHY